ncbi:MAG: CooT family nickel-binding protein [Spirochaetes bacterium]|nr:CooT family nickel-binding protein [Spirochaetota bacterium]
MCLSRVYTGELKDENCVMEETMRVESHDGGIELSTIYGEKKTLHNYSVNTVDFMKSYVILKKTDEKQAHSHIHEHSREFALHKLSKLLPYLLEHNDSHVSDLKKWVQEAEEAGYDEVAEELKASIELFAQIGNHFEKAISLL